MQVSKQVKISIKDKINADKIRRKIFNKYGLDENVDKSYLVPTIWRNRESLLSTALVSDTKVIIADEPTPGLDEKSLNEALQNFRDIADNGCQFL